METYKSIIAYDGTDYLGFQRQAEGLRTVQGELEEALRRLGWQEKSIKAAGRTDTGVHARGQVISYALNWLSEGEDLTRALNANLPGDVAVWDTETTCSSFHPRFSAQSRRYSYMILCTENRHPLRERYAWRIWPAPSLESMSAIAEWLVGRRDFAAFGQAPFKEGHTIRQVFQAMWKEIPEGMVFEIEADAFLYHMVRRLVAAMILVDRKPDRKEDFRQSLTHPSRRWKGSIAPPNGLCLEEVVY
jgi:tRNA pseudouridine38-40 synthase